MHTHSHAKKISAVKIGEGANERIHYRNQNKYLDTDVHQQKRLTLFF